MTNSKDHWVAYPGLELQYPSKSNAFIRKCLGEDLGRIASQPIGKDLLRRIAAAHPATRSGSNGGDRTRGIKFDRGINVIFVPTTMEYVQSGYKKTYLPESMDKTLTPTSDAQHNLAGRSFTPDGGCCAIALDVEAASNGTGSVSVVEYTGAQTFTRSNEDTYSFIVLAHELIHALHHVTGTTQKVDEEDATTGIGPYAQAMLTENSFRQAFGLPQRQRYSGFRDL